VKEGAASGNLTLTIAHYAGANQSALIVEHMIIFLTEDSIDLFVVLIKL